MNARARISVIACVAAAIGFSASADDPLPSLDELLGLEEAGESRERLDLDPARRELERKLTQEEAREQFQQAVELMTESAFRIADAGDTGRTTQRLQEDILRKLDQVIETAKQNQQNQSQQQSSSSSSSSNQQSQQPTQAQQESNQPSNGENTGENAPPGSTEASLAPDLPAARAAWGNLPGRTRDALLEGLSDRYSVLYRRLTEAYYRKLAEEAEE